VRHAILLPFASGQAWRASPGEDAQEAELCCNSNMFDRIRHDSAATLLRDCMSSNPVPHGANLRTVGEHSVAFAHLF